MFVHVRRASRNLSSLSSLALLSALTLIVGACSDDTIPDTMEGGAPACAEGGGAVALAPEEGGTDEHCREEDGTPIIRAATTCTGEPSANTGEDAAAEESDAGESDASDVEPEVPPHAGNEANDDDCKFHVALRADCVARDRDVTFTMIPTSLADGSAVSGADPYIEATLDGRPSPNVRGVTTESNGVYQIPARFDRAGRWTVRIHLFPACFDTETSKHAHVGFYVDVP
jgi:hypothetical protein